MEANLDFEFTPSQLPFFLDKSLDSVMSGGVGSGKTITGIRKFFKNRFLNWGLNGLYNAPTESLLMSGFIPQFEKLCKDYGIYFKLDKKYMVAQTGFGGALVFCRTGKNPDSIVNFEVGDAAIDEPGVQPEEVKDRVAARVRQPGAKILQTNYTGTPEPGKKSDWWKNFVESLKENCVFKASTYETLERGWIHESFIQKLFGTYSKQMLLSYLEGSFSYFDDDRSISNYDLKRHAMKEYVYNPKIHELLISMDFNVNPLCWNIYQEHNGILYQIDEIHLGTKTRKADTRKAMKRLLHYFGFHDGLWVFYGDASARKVSTVDSTKNDLLIIKEYMRNAKKRCLMKINTFNPSVSNTVTLLNGLFDPADGVPKVMISRKCEHTKEDLALATDNKKDNEKKGIGHHLDAKRYIVHKRFKIKDFLTLKKKKDYIRYAG